MSEYESVGGGSLKFKGGGIVKKKKKKTDASKVVKAAVEARESTPPSTKPIKVIEKTAAELKFLEVQRKRQEEKVLKSAMKSHKEKVAELNRKLEEMTEHYDIPKVGPG
ncbi:protein FAM32A [Entomortierella parvispora]|uniref:Protein FAM32A n=1 Tax=Entomortierella parvispora TaxID=205924 RepID=A0A9P3HHT5_9FUNG|nr:protein FAM32A [Entomortierella parvispora]